MKLELIILDKSAERFSREAKKIVQCLATALAGQAGFLRKKGVIEVYLVAGKRMRMLNRKFMNKNKDTNVLSFVAPKDFVGGSLGEVYLNPIFIKKNKQDLDLMLAHGVLHILGYDHKGKSDRIKMEKKEEELLLKIRSMKPN